MEEDKYKFCPQTLNASAVLGNSEQQTMKSALVKIRSV